jgi:imidazole glycerol-phosphate synthase subunit HisF
MLKKRLIFTLLYCNGYFMLSRNFRLQKVGNLQWLQSNINFSQVSYSIDELVVLDVSRGMKNSLEFCNALKQVTQGCFAPISAGGGINTIESARNLLRSGADKVVLNSALYDNSVFVRDLAGEFGQQCVVASIDIKASLDGTYKVWSESGVKCLEGSAANWIDKVLQQDVGELYLNSIDRDGTGQGYEFGMLNLLPLNITKPVILAGGAGNATHLCEGLSDPRVDAVATAHLFNFVGDGLKQARQSLVSDGIDLPIWDIEFAIKYLAADKAAI